MKYYYPNDAFAIRLASWFFHAKSGIEKDRKKADLFRDIAVKSRKDRGYGSYIPSWYIVSRIYDPPGEDPAVDRNPETFFPPLKAP